MNSFSHLRTKSVWTATFIFLVVLAVKSAEIAANLNGPGEIVLDGEYVYFTDNSAANGIVKRVPKTGGLVTTLITNAALFDSGAWRGVAQLQVTSDSLFGHYGGYATCNIFQAPKSGGAFTNLVIGFSGGGLIGVVSSDLFYFYGFDHLYRLPLGGGAGNSDWNTVWPRSSAFDYTALYFVDWSTKDVKRHDLVTRSGSTLIGQNSAEGSIFINNAHVFFNLGGAIKRVPKTGGSVTTLVSSGTATGYCADGATVFYVDGSAIKTVSVNGGVPATLQAVPANSVGSMAVDGSFLYWTDVSGGPGMGKIRRVSKPVPFPPQKIFLAFGQASSFGLVVPTVFGRAYPVVNPFGSIPAVSVSESYRTSVTTQIKEAFSRSSIQNIEWTATDSDDAIAVYFCSTVNSDLLGYSKGLPDRSNERRRGDVIVFVNESLPGLDAETAAHEIGHALGLRHVDPPVALDPSNNEVMDLDVSLSPQFMNAVSDVTDFTSPFSTHNPLYHLLRYVDGWSASQLQEAGISPGSWDNGSTIKTRFSFQNENLRLYHITVFASGGTAESSFTLEQIPSATLAELSERDFALPEGLGIVLLASSTTNGHPDVISSTGDAFSPTNQIISSTGTNAFSLFRQDSATNAVEVSTATAAFDTQTPYCKLFVSTPGILRIDFRGTLQTSTTLTNWTDVGTNVTSPHFIVIGPNNGSDFFRSRQ